MTTHLMDVTMDRQADEVAAEFNKIDTATRMTLAFLKQATQPAALTLLNRYAARHTRDYHRALDKLEAIQEKRQDQEEVNPPNEPEPIPTPEPSTTSAAQLATLHASLATPTQLATGHRPLTTDLNPPNEPEPIPTPEPSTTSSPQLDTRHSSLATPTETGHRPPATDH